MPDAEEIVFKCVQTLTTAPPLPHRYDFCRFIREYRHPDAPTYCIHPITDELSDLPTKLSLPGVIGPDDL
jgi:hypothetical protein